MFKKLIVCGCSLLVSGMLTFASASAQQSTPTATSEIVVTTLNDSGAGSLRQAIADSEAGGTITFDSSLAGTIVLKQPANIPAYRPVPQTLTITRDLTIHGAPGISIDGSGIYSVFSVSKHVTFSMDHLTIQNGMGGVGGLENDGGTVMVVDSAFRNNADGAIFNRSDSTLTIDQVTFSDNLPSAYTLIENAGTLHISNSTFAGNSLMLISNSGNTTVETSLFTNNGSFTQPIFMNENTGTLQVSNATFDSNYGIIDNGGQANFTNDTLSNNNIMNRITFGGITSNITVTNSIIVSQLHAFTCPIKITDGGGNIQFPDNDCGVPVANPKLAPLADNGGPTQTMALLPGSAAIGIAISSICQNSQIDNVDQRGMLRPVKCDAGAFQTNAGAMSATSSPPGVLPPVSNLTATFPVSQ